MHVICSLLIAYWLPLMPICSAIVDMGPGPGPYEYMGDSYQSAVVRPRNNTLRQSPIGNSQKGIPTYIVIYIYIYTCLYVYLYVFISDFYLLCHMYMLSYMIFTYQYYLSLLFMTRARARARSEGPPADDPAAPRAEGPTAPAHVAGPGWMIRSNSNK